MIEIEEQLAAIGFGRCCNRADCDWRAVRVERPVLAKPSRRAAVEPACSRALLQWRDLLRRGSRASPYRISRV